MAQWMDRNTEGFTHMGGEELTGSAVKFLKTDHVFQNIGDGTYNHSGLMSIRAAVASGVNITYKILFNDAVAMTGGQGHDGKLDVVTTVKELQAIGLKKVVVIYDKKEDLNITSLRSIVETFPRDDLMKVQTELSLVTGVSALLRADLCCGETT